LKVVLGLNVPASAIEIRSVGEERLVLVGGKILTDILLSISHSSNYIAAAGIVSKSEYRSLGVDIERERIIETVLAKRFMDETEFKYWQALPAETQSSQGILMWSLKEAWGKALGTGLRTNPKTFNTLPYLEQNHTVCAITNVWWTKVEKDYILTTIQLQQNYV
jgi:phosphopantetheinyl transferase